MESIPGTLLCVGISYRLAPISVLERAAHEAEAVRGAFSDAATRDTFPFRELVLLSTCNRVEFYAVCRPPDAARAASLLTSAFTRADQASVYEYRDLDALRHLCRVTAGIDSMVVGEPQIAGQVARAFASVVHVNGGPPELQDAVTLARRVARRARAETAIGRKPASISSVAVHVGAEQLAGLAGKRVLVLGAGKMGRLAVEALSSARAQVRIANRTAARAMLLARRASAVPVPLLPIDKALADADLVIASTASPTPLIDADTVRRALASRTEAERSLLLIDIAVPRNVSPDVRDVAGVQLIGIEELHARIARHLDERRRCIPEVEALIEQELSTRSGTHRILIRGGHRD